MRESHLAASQLSHPIGVLTGAFGLSIVSQTCHFTSHSPMPSALRQLCSCCQGSSRSSMSRRNRAPTPPCAFCRLGAGSQARRESLLPRSCTIGDIFRKFFGVSETRSNTPSQKSREDRSATLWSLQPPVTAHRLDRRPQEQAPGGREELRDQFHVGWASRSL